MKLAAQLAGAAAVIVALVVPIGLGVLWGQHLLHQTPQPQPQPQPRTQLTVKLDPAAVPQLAARALFEEVRGAMRETRIGFASIAPSGECVEVTLREGDDREQAIAWFRELSRQPGSTAGAQAEKFTIADAGGAVLRLAPTPSTIAEAMARMREQTIDVLRRRIESQASTPIFNLEGEDRIVIEVPGRADTTELKARIVKPGKLALRFVDTSVDVEAARLGQVPPNSEILPDQTGAPLLVERRVAVSGESLVDANAGFDQRTNEPIVSFRLNALGTRQFARLTGEKIGSPFAVVLDDVVLAAPVIREPILGGSGQISGNFTPESANNLAVLLRSGALPVPLTIVAERTLEPSMKSAD
jgi:preprotein translocase subunit SecD